MDPLSAIFSGAPFAGSGNPSSGNDLQLAPIYSNQIHRAGGETHFPHERNDLLGDYEEEQETYSNVDANGIHFGARMSRTHQTPFGPARASAGMQMSFSEDGVMMSSQRNSSFGFGGGRMLMFSFHTCPHHHHTGHRRYDPMRSLLSPFGGLFSPHGGLFSSMSDDPSLFGGQANTGSQHHGENNRSDGPIIEEISDEEESGHPGSKIENTQCIEYNQEDIDESLGLGLLPDEETFENCDQGNRSDSERNGSLNDFAFSGKSPSTNENDRITDTKKKQERKVKRNKNKNRQRDKSQILDAKNEVEKITEKAENNEDTSNFKDQPQHPQKFSQKPIDGLDLQSENANEHAKLESKPEQKFTKQELRNIPLLLDNDLMLDDDLNKMLSLGSPTFEKSSYDKSSTEFLNDNRSDNMRCKKKVNKNSVVRCRRDSSDSTSSNLSKQLDNVSAKSNDINMNTATSHTESIDTPEDSFVNENEIKSTCTVCSSTQSPLDLKEKKLHDMHALSISPIDFTKQSSAETADNKVTGTGTIVGEMDTSFEQDGIQRGASGDDRYSPEPDNHHSHDNKGYLTENTSLNGSVINSLEIDTFEAKNDKDSMSNGKSNTESNSELVKEEDVDNWYKDMALQDKENGKAESELNFADDNSIDNSLGESNLQILESQSNRENLGNARGSSLFKFTLKFESDDGYSGEETTFYPKRIIFIGSKPKDSHNSDKEITHFMPSKDRKKEAGQMFEVKHFEECWPTEDIHQITPDDKSQHSEPTDAGNLSAEESDIDGNIFESMLELRQKSENERTSPELELFNFETHNPLEKFSPAGFKLDGNNQVISSERESNNRPMRKSERNANNYGDENFMKKRNKSQQNKGNVATIQWENPGQRSNNELSNNRNQNAKQNSYKSNFTEEYTFNEEHEESEEWHQNGARPHFYSGGNNRHRNPDMSSEDLSNLSFIRSSQRTHSNDRKFNAPEQNTPSINEEQNPPLGRYKFPKQNTSQSPYVYGGQHGQNNKVSQEEMMQSNSFTNYENDSTEIYDHMCPHMRLQAQCEHKFIYKEFHDCCNQYHYFCEDCGKQMTLKDYKMQNRDDDDILQHPEWQFLDDYRDETEQFSKPKSNQKPKINKNKNAKVKESAISALSTQDASLSTQLEEARPRSDFHDLVESVGLVMKDVYPDGNCLFTSVCDQLRIRGDFSYTPRELRHAAVDFLREHPNQDDGTPLLDFLTDEERNWEKYLSSMRRDGHWGDHFVIWALSHVLNRRIVIYCGDKELHRTIVEPSASLKTSPSKEDVEDSTQENKSKEADSVEDVKVEQEDMEEMYLGHISESHYVSLRPKNWREELFEELKKKKTSSLVGVNPHSKALESDRDMKQDVPQIHLSFAMKYIRMSDLIIYRPSIVSVGSRSFCSSEFYTEDTYISFANVKNDTDYQNLIKVMMIPHDTKIYIASTQQTLMSKDLLLKTQNCSPGCTKLQVVDPTLWLKSVDKDDCLKQLYVDTAFQENTSKRIELAFPSEWPEGSIKWPNRKRKQIWPKQGVVDKIKMTGCLVIPKCASTCSCPSTEWKFTFQKAEKIMDEDAVSEDQLDCLLIAKLALDSVIDKPFTIKQLKHVLYTLCEETEAEKWQTELADCVWNFLDRLKEFIRCRHIPNYFMPMINLLDDDVVDDDYISGCIDGINIVQKHPFVTLFSLCDASSLYSVEMKMLFDSLNEDSIRYALAKDLDTSVHECFIPVVADGVSAAVRLNSYLKALEKCQEAIKHMNLLFKDGKVLHLEDLISKVILLSYRDLDKWMFAFAADQKLGTFFTETVCAGLKSVSIFNYFGPFLADTLRMSSPDILIPGDLVNERNLPETTCCMLDILENICPKSVFQELVFFLLENNVPLMVQNVSQFPITSKFVTKVIGKIRENLPQKPKSMRI